MSAALRAVTFNGWVGQGRQDGTENVEELLDVTGTPHIVALQEAHWLDRIPGYRIHRAEGDREDRNIALLIRKDLGIHDAGLLEMRHPRWTGPKHGLTHAPRVMPWAEVSLPGEWRRWCILDVHRITSTHGRNDHQRGLELDQLDAWLTAHRRGRHPRRPIVALGDWNGHPRTLAQAHDGEFTLVDVDGALTINAEVTYFHELRGRYGSDSHHPIALTIARKARP